MPGSGTSPPISENGRSVRKARDERFPRVYLRYAPRGINRHGAAFCSTAGVSEDLVTGIAAGALGCYLLRNCPDRVPRQDRHSFLMEQGYNFGREGRVYVDVDQSADTITSVRVGGTAVILFEAPFSLDEAG